MCEIRFKLTNSDGKLYSMTEKISKDVRTEVIKEAMLFYFRNIRDNKVESNYISSSLFEEFNENVQPNQFNLNDIFRLLESRPATSVAQQTTTSNTSNSADNNCNYNESYEEECEEEYEEDCEEDCEDEDYITDEDIF